MNKKETIFGYISFYVFPIEIVILIIGFLLYYEPPGDISRMIGIFSTLFFSALVAVVLGIIGLLIALIKKRHKKRLSIWGIILNLLIPIAFIVGLFSIMGGP